MAVTLTTMTLTPTWSGKGLTVSGDASVRESVLLRVAGCGDDTSVVVKIVSDNGRVEYAKYPFAAGDVWTVDGEDLTGTINLNTVPMVAAFGPYGPLDKLGFVIVVASATNSNLYAKACKQFGNWVESDEDPVAYSTPLADDVATLQEDLDALEASFAAHTHNGTDAPRVSHLNLTNIGTNTHAEIDAALIGHTASIATNSSNITSNTVAIGVLDGRADDLQTAILTDEIVDLPATVDDTSPEDFYNTLASVLAFIATVKGSQT